MSSLLTHLSLDKDIWVRKYMIVYKCVFIANNKANIRILDKLFGYLFEHKMWNEHTNKW